MIFASFSYSSTIASSTLKSTAFITSSNFLANASQVTDVKSKKPLNITSIPLKKSGICKSLSINNKVIIDAIHILVLSLTLATFFISSSPLSL